MTYNKLENNLIDVLAEQQLKLGYNPGEVVHLYYPVGSLNRLLGTDLSVNDIIPVLAGFSQAARADLGDLDVTHDGERFCFTIPPQGSTYVHEHMGRHEFLIKFIDTVSHHGTTIDDVVAVFREYSDHVKVEKMNDDDFDYLVYFTDGIPDDYRYCLKDEGVHIIYHRFTPDDYNDMFH